MKSPSLTSYADQDADFRRDTDAATVLTPDEQREELAAHWRGLSHRDRKRWLADATADDLDALAEALDAKAGWTAILDGGVAHGLALARPAEGRAA